VTAKERWALTITSVALCIVMLDNLVVLTALPVIRVDLHASVEQLEWTVNAYTLTFAVLLLTGAALGDRFGRRRMFVVGLSIFIAASAAAALSTNIHSLVVARAVQGAGAALVTPLTMTLLSRAFPAQRRGLALGIWTGVSGISVAAGPVVGGAVTQGISWHWIFWLNVPIGLALLPFAAIKLEESHGPYDRLDFGGLVLASVGLFALVWGLINANSKGWTSLQTVAVLVAGALLMAAFVIWERHAHSPMLPMRFFRIRSFAAANAASFFMYFGMFGSIFLLAQFLQTAQGYSPLAAGLRLLPWTAAPLAVAPPAGILAERLGSRPLMVIGLALQAIALGWVAAIASPTVPYLELVWPLIVAGIGMAMFFAPTALVVLGAVRSEEEGQASGANNAIRELGGVFGVAILAGVFAAHGGYGSPQSFTDGTVAAAWVGTIVLAVGALVSLAVPRRITRPSPEADRRITASWTIAALAPDPATEDGAGVAPAPPRPAA
jgi:EmrB/QacA subfamily drug resistance transporter